MAPRRKPTAAAAAASEKNTKRLKKNGQEDLISELPDSILHHILSFLDMKYVIPTSFLSRRWRYLWTSLPFLNINNEIYKRLKKQLDHNIDYDEYELSQFNKIDFTDFVDRLLLMRDQKSGLHTFRFSYNGTEIDINREKIAGDLYLWVLFLVRNNFEVLDLRLISWADKLDLPSCLFTCKSLTTLKLDMSMTEHYESRSTKFILPIKSMVSLPALKTLHFRFLSIVGDIQNLISKCPVLETLIIANCTISTSGNRGSKKNTTGNQLIISASQLKSVVIEELQDETSSVNYCKVKVLAPKLTSFRCRDSSINEYTFGVFSSLVNAEIETGEYEEPFYSTDDGKESEFCALSKKNYIKRLAQCLNGVYNVESLKLSACILKVIIEGPTDLKSLRIAPFCNLRSLELKTSLSGKEIRGIMYFMEKCPNLETFVLKLVESYTLWSNFGEEEDGWEAESGPPCKMDHLKYFEIWDVLTSVNELEFLKFLLKKAIILKKMIVHTPNKQPPGGDMKLKRFVDKLKTFPAASSMGRIFFLSDAKPRKPDVYLPVGRELSDDEDSFDDGFFFEFFFLYYSLWMNLTMINFGFGLDILTRLYIAVLKGIHMYELNLFIGDADQVYGSKWGVIHLFGVGFILDV